MAIASILKDKGGAIIAATPSQTVAEVVALLCEHRIGAVIVMEDGAVAGVLSERDVVRGLNEQGASILQCQARDIMTTEVITVAPSESVTAALSQMTRRRIRHLPVIDGDQVRGVVSIGDLVKARIDEAVREAESLKDYISHA
ncbi:CBS domain-containing protein [Sphingosinicella soli]|uniref:CBS domain-containing protein n=1 Tax=Sphingosinicella soli TaxID=333708 RepID=A0A7W7B413_9SPHN|nr:CBS domain-containing protein [Sphingosinicella soli]MBB4633565.1 CBS domain-containing protein [Sphingosinicella soli]